MNEKIRATLKSLETEDWFDLHVIRPFCYYCAVFFAKFDIHPNTITIWSMIIGAASAWFFAQGSWYYSLQETGSIWMGLIYNIIGIFLLMWGDIFDCTDGQLARMTGKKSRMGRILDGLAGFAWFFPIYIALVYRFYMHHEWEFRMLGIEDNEQNTLIATAVVFVLAAISGLWGLQGQQRLADYYIQVHLFFQNGEKGSELDNSARQKEIYEQMPKDAPFYERWFQKSYIEYTKKQESVTPEFQKLMAKLREKYGSSDNIPQEVRDEVHSNSRSLMKWNSLMTFNFREFWLFVFCLVDFPVGNFLWEIIVLGMIFWYVNHRHETFCKKIAAKL